MSILPRFITLEGIEGVGKSTHLLALRHFLEQRGIQVQITREPGGTEIGEKLRALLLQSAIPMHYDTELLLMFAARAEHIQQVIRPALAAGQWVISDRFTDSTYAYQGAGRGIDWQQIAFLENWVQGDFRPDRTLLLDAPVEIGLQRVHRRLQQDDRFEREQLTFFQKVRAGYLTLAANHPQRFRVIDATHPLPEVSQRLIAALEELL